MRNSPNSFSESAAWKQFGDGWRQLHGSYAELGFSFEWHDFVARERFDWGRSFHPGSIEICLNISGRASIAGEGIKVEFEPMMAGFYRQNDDRLHATREAGVRHRFLTVELAPSFLENHLDADPSLLHPMVSTTLAGDSSAAAAPPVRLTAKHQELIGTLRQPPVFASAQKLWYQAKTLEIMSAFLFKPPAEKELFCHRQNRLAQDRVERVVAILKRNLAEPPTLEALGKEVGCSSFYLSRIFSQEVGKTISQYLRALRMERAAELLREGKHNVTEVAMEVGYASSSHFSTAFHETFGCCPGLYPLPLKIGGAKSH
jgi:AraC family transcriptional regulator